MPVQNNPTGDTEYVMFGRKESLVALKDAQTVLLNPAPSVPVPMKAYAVASLPTGLASGYAIAFVTDANATTRLSTPAGGGSNKLLVFTANNGTDWAIL